MPLIYPLVMVTILSLLLSNVARKNPAVFYTIAGAIATASTVIELVKLNTKVTLQANLTYLEKLSLHGNYSISCFILVMFAGALNSKWAITKKLLSIRAQLSIIGSILIVPHIIIYTFYTIKGLLSHTAFTTAKWTYIIAGLVAFIIMVPLFLTSLKKFRSKMKFPEWKKLQRWAYPFYFLVYLHIIVILLNSKKPDYTRIYAYSIIFGLYLILKLFKTYNKKNLVQA